jgi:hypothetical protein
MKVQNTHRRPAAYQASPFHHVTYSQVADGEEGLQMRREAINILNKH